MSSFMDRATAHYKDAVAGELRSLEVPEWNQTIYYRTAFTLHQNRLVIRAQNEGRSEEAIVETFIAHARDENGEPLCKPADRVQLLRSVDQRVLDRVVTEMLGDAVVASVEEARKNSETTSS